jgi:hypothetical protein
MKKRILSLSILLTSLSISAQLNQITEYWNIQHTNLRSQYAVNKVTNEKQGAYKAWSVGGNLILECNYAKDKLHGKYTEYYDTPGLKVSTTVNYKNDEKDGWETVYQWYPKNYLGFDGKEQYYLKYKQEYKLGIATQNRVEFTEENDTLVYSRQIEDKIILKSGFWSNKSTERFEIKKIKNEKIYEKQWKKINNNWILTYNKDDENKIWVLYYDNGNKHIESVDGAPDFIGHKEITYSENGKPQTIKSFKKGEKECFYLATYDENGKIMNEQRKGDYTNSYENGLLVRKDSSDYTFLYYANGKMRKAINNKLHVEVNYDENEIPLNKIGRNYEERYSVENGNNITVVYYQKKLISKYINDKLRFEVKDNITTEYDEKGNKTSEISYKQAQAPYIKTSDGRYYVIGSSYYEKSYSNIGYATIEVKKEFDTNGNLASLKETVYMDKDKDGTDIVVTDITYNPDGIIKTELKRTNNDRAVIYTMFEYEYPKEKQKIKSKREIKRVTF